MIFINRFKTDDFRNERRIIIQDVKEEGIEYFSKDRAKDLPIDERKRKIASVF